MEFDIKCPAEGKEKSGGAPSASAPAGVSGGASHERSIHRPARVVRKTGSTRASANDGARGGARHLSFLHGPAGDFTRFELTSRSNKALRDAIATIKGARDEVRLRQAKKEAIASRYANRAPGLAGVLEKAAKDNKLDIPESQDKPEVPHGKKYIERTTVVRLRKAGMLALGKTLESLEQQHMPVAITRLNIRRRGGEHDSYDVELGISAFDRDPGKESSPGGAAK